MRNARLDDAQARTKTARRNTNNLRYADDTALRAESKEELRSLLMKMKEESEKADLKLNIQITKIMASSGPSAFYKSSLNIWKFSVHILLWPALEIFEHTLLVCEMSPIVQ